jgi:hypothetical protein
MAVLVLATVGVLGFLVVWLAGTRLNVFEITGAGMALSLAFAAVAGSLLLRLGVFQWWSMAVAAGASGLLAWVAARGRPRLHPTPPEKREWWAVTAVLLAIAIPLLATPRWNFQLAYGMDAGNYEAHADYYETAGRLYYDYSEAVEAGVPARWLAMRNTWTAPEGRPFYVPGFGAVLGLAREALHGDLTSSSLVMMVVGLLNALLLYLVARRAKAPPVVAAVVTALVVTTVMYFFYAKQIMSEQLALTGMLGFLYAIQMEGDGEKGWFPPILGGAGAALLAITKLDGIANVAFLTLGMWSAVQLGLWRGTRISKRLAGMTAVALVITTAFITVVGLPQYLRHTSLGSSVGALSGLPFADFPLLLPMAVVAGGLLVHLSIQSARHPSDGDPRGDVRRWMRVGFLVLWLAFMLYNATLRPLGETLDNHDALNLIRLWAVSSPVLLVAAGLATARDRDLPGASPALGVGLMLAFAWGIYGSRHAPIELWWMRRYLVVLMPLFVLAGVGAAAQLQRFRVRSWLLGGAAALLVVAQLGRLLPFLDYRQMSAAPTRLVSLESEIPDDAPLVVLGELRVVRALGYTLASRRDGMTVHNVETVELGDALELVDAPGREFVLSPSRFDANVRRELGLELVAEGVVSLQWSGWYADVVEDPDAEQVVASYWVYAHRTDS